MIYNSGMQWNPGHSCLKVALACFLMTSGVSYGNESRWIRLRSTDFELFSSANPRNARDTIREFEEVRSFFIQAFGKPPSKPLPVRLVSFGSVKEYEPYRFNEFAAAYYQPTADRDYIVMSHGGVDTFPMAVHEYVHLVLKHAGLKLPPWVNEGLAELFSTLRPVGDKILVGDLIPGRRRALFEERWVPLTVILAVDRHSAYYNEKNKAGSLYNEGWALTHMLYFHPDYRPRFNQLVRTISDGKNSAEALLQVYGRGLDRIEKDLQSYLRGDNFRAVLVPAKLEKVSEEIPIETPADFDTALMLADLIDRPEKQPAYQAALERLIQQDAARPEPYRELGYSSWRAGRTEDAIQQFGKAFERGDRNPKLLWDYGRLLERKQGEEAIRVLSALLAQDTERLEVRLELAETQLREDHPKAVLATLAPVHSVTQGDAARFFRIGVYAHLRNGDQEEAEKTAKHFRDIAKTDEERSEAELLVSQSAIGKPVEAFKPGSQVATDAVEDSGRPTLRHASPATDSNHIETVTAHKQVSVTGRFVELVCQGKQARMVLETPAGRKVFLIQDPGNVAITAGSAGPADLQCGPQKSPAKIEIGYDPPSPNQSGVDGVVRTLAF